MPSKKIDLIAGQQKFLNVPKPFNNFLIQESNSLLDIVDDLQNKTLRVPEGSGIHYKHKQSHGQFGITSPTTQTIIIFYGDDEELKQWATKVTLSGSMVVLGEQAFGSVIDFANNVPVMMGIRSIPGNFVDYPTTSDGINLNVIRNDFFLQYLALSGNFFSFLWSGLNNRKIFTFEIYGLTGADTLQVKITPDYAFRNSTFLTPVINRETGAAVPGGTITADGLYQADITGVHTLIIVSPGLISSNIGLNGIEANG